MSERLDRSVAGNNSDTAACGVRNDDVRDEIGSPKAAAFTLPPPPHRRRRRAHRFIHASSSSSTEAAAAHEGLPDPSADRPAFRLVDGRGYVIRIRSLTHARHGRTNTRAHGHTLAHTYTHASAGTARARLQPRRKLSGFGVCSVLRVGPLYCSTRLRTRIAAAVVNYASTWPPQPRPTDTYDDGV